MRCDRVDVVMPVFNSEFMIVGAVGSILRQSFADFRLIVIDDGSTDATAGLLADMAATDGRMLAITKENGGIVDALNAGLGICEAEFVARHDGDDIAFPHRFEEQIDYLAKHGDCIAVSNNVWHIDANGVRVGATHGYGDAVGNLDSVPAGEPHLIHPFLMARFAAIRQVGGYRHVLHAEDADLYFRLEPLGRLHVLQERLGEYRIHSGSITSGSIQNVRAGAVYSQLAAVSARRRLMGVEDLAFTKALAAHVQRASSLASMIAVAQQQLDAQEREYLEVATAAKMLQLQVYRRFQFGLSDMRTIAVYIWRYRSRIPARDRRLSWKRLSGIIIGRDSISMSC